MSATGAMYDDYYSRLINDDSNFYPRDGNEVIRIYGHEVRQAEMRPNYVVGAELCLSLLRDGL